MLNVSAASASKRRRLDPWLQILHRPPLPTKPVPIFPSPRKPLTLGILFLPTPPRRLFPHTVPHDITALVLTSSAGISVMKGMRGGVTSAGISIVCLLRINPQPYHPQSPLLSLSLTLCHPPIFPRCPSSCANYIVMGSNSSGAPAGAAISMEQHLSLLGSPAGFTLPYHPCQTLSALSAYGSGKPFNPNC